MRAFAYLALFLACTACSTSPNEDSSAQIDPLAERYVKLALAKLLSYPPTPLLLADD